MKKTQLLLVCLIASAVIYAQPAPEKDDSWKNIYRGSATKINDLVHTKLEVKFDYDKSYMYGKEWVTLKPHFYPTDSLTLDAKGMENAFCVAARCGNPFRTGAPSQHSAGARTGSGGPGKTGSEPLEPGCHPAENRRDPLDSGRRDVPAGRCGRCAGSCGPVSRSSR